MVAVNLHVFFRPKYSRVRNCRCYGTEKNVVQPPTQPLQSTLAMTVVTAYTRAPSALLRDRHGQPDYPGHGVVVTLYNLQLPGLQVPSCLRYLPSRELAARNLFAYIPGCLGLRMVYSSLNNQLNNQLIMMFCHSICLAQVMLAATQVCLYQLLSIQHASKSRYQINCNIILHYPSRGYPNNNAHVPSHVPTHSPLWGNCDVTHM